MYTFKTLSRWLLLPILALLGGCNTVLMNPSGDVAVQQRDLILVSTGLMLLIIVPVIAATLLFAWRYRKANKTAVYTPDWDHSTQLELLIWGAPLLIIIALGAVTWISTHTLDPYRPLARIDNARQIPAGTKPLIVEVVALDWKWLFLYPEQGIATVNELAAPVDRPIQFKITASSVMNSFFIPALAGQIYAMPGMQTELNAIINKPGEYTGLSSNYSGAGFSGMHFKFHGLSTGDFDQWVAKNKAIATADGVAENGELSRSGYLELERPSANEAVRRYASVAPGLYDAILNRCVEANKMCAKDMMAIDARGGLGRPGAYNVASSESKPGRNYVGAMCSVSDPVDAFALTGTTSSLPVSQRLQ